jgi:hypothetical protein
MRDRWYRLAPIPRRVHHAPMVGRLLAVCGWLAWRVGRSVGGLGSALVIVLGVVLLVVAAVPIVVPLLDPQPQTAGVQEIFDGAITEPDGWVRLHGRIVPLQEPPTADRGGPFALLVDAEASLRSIVVVTDAEVDADAVITGHL